LSQALDTVLAPAREALSGALFCRVRSHLYSQLLCMGRHTITGLLSTQGRVHQDWSADYRLYANRRLDPEVLFGCVRQELRTVRKERDPLVLALDDSLLRKRGPRAHGVKWLRDPLGPPFSINFVRGQRVVQFSAALPSGPAQARMVPVDFQHAPAPPKVPAEASPEERAAIEVRRKEENINAVAARRLRHLAAQERCPVVTVCDGRFANRAFLRKAPAQSTIITRIRKDTALFWPVERQPHTGRRRIYGERAPTPEELRQDESKPWQRVRAFACGRMHQFKVKRLQGVLSPILGAPACQLLVIAPLGYRPRAGSKLLYRQPAYLLCTDPKLSLRRLLQYYLWRWDIEVNFRDEKTVLGVGQAQVRTPESTGRVPATAVAAYGLLLAAAARAFPNQEDPRLFPPPRWRTKSPPRPSTSALLDHLRFELFAHALKPESFTGFWSRPYPNQKLPKLPVALASSLFHRRL
jgi:DDE superfamily endonuclease